MGDRVVALLCEGGYAEEAIASVGIPDIES